MKIIVMGMGYVGLSNAVLLAQTNEVIGLEIDHKKVESINNKKSLLKDDYIIDYLANKDLNLIAKTSGEEDFKNADLVILALPTNYDETTQYFDTSFLDDAIKMIKDIRSDLPILIKSTIPIGYTEGKNKEYDCENIIFSPEYDPRPNWRRKITKPTCDLERKLLAYFVKDKVFYQDNEVGEIVRNYLIWSKGGEK